MQKQLEEDLSRAKSQDGQSGELSRAFVDREILAVNQRIHAVSQRVEHLSDRVHKLSEHVENIPEKIAELKLEMVETEEKVQKNSKTASAPPTKAPKSLIASKAPKSLAAGSKTSFWGVQVGAYSTKSAAEKGWSEMLSEGSALELNDAKVQYILSKPKKDGRRLSLIVINQYPNRNAAFLACKGLRGQGVDCVPVHVTP